MLSIKQKQGREEKSMLLYILSKIDNQKILLS